MSIEKFGDATNDSLAPMLANESRDSPNVLGGNDAIGIAGKVDRVCFARHRGRTCQIAGCLHCDRTLK